MGVPAVSTTISTVADGVVAVERSSMAGEKETVAVFITVGVGVTVATVTAGLFWDPIQMESPSRATVRVTKKEMRINVFPGILLMYLLWAQGRKNCKRIGN